MTDVNHDLTRNFDRNHAVTGWIFFCYALCAASHQQSRRLVRGVERFGRDQGIEEEAPECNVKRSGEWLNKAPMDCCVKSGEVEPGVRVTGKNTELVKIISTKETPMTWATSK